MNREVTAGHEHKRERVQRDKLPWERAGVHSVGRGSRQGNHKDIQLQATLVLPGTCLAVRLKIGTGSEFEGLKTGAFPGPGLSP